MYESPIELVVTDLATRMDIEYGQMILKAAQRVGVNVNKYELLQALKYDRQQYEKGYKDGAREIMERLKDEIGINCDLVDVYEHIDNLLKEVEGNTE